MAEPHTSRNSGSAWRGSLILTVCVAAVVSHASVLIRPVTPQTSSTRSIGFTLLEPAITGVNFTNLLSDEKAAENQIRLNGSGVALGDIDNDGRVDIYLCGLENENRLFRNLGELRFADVTASSGTACPGQYSAGCALADVDGDRDLDLLVTGLGVGARLFLNDGTGKFSEQNESGLIRRFGATSLALADVDGDGDLDLYVVNYRTTTIRTTGFALLNINGKRMVRPADRDSLELTPEGKVLEHGEPDAFYINDGGKFIRVSWTGGGFLNEDGQPLTAMPRDWGLSAMFRDMNRDGWPDLYVCNDFHSPDRIWINTGQGSFRAIPKLALRNTSTFSMSIDFADIDRDGRDDFFLADMLDPRRERRMAQFSAMEASPSTIGVFEDRPQYDRNTLHWNRGDGTYAEIAHYAGIEAAGWAWCANFLDVDLDGFEDLLLTTGHMFDTQDLDAADRILAAGPWAVRDIPKKLLMFPRLRMPKAAFRNDGRLRFSEVGREWGFADEGVAHGMGFADLDNDGDLDVVVNNLNAPAGVYRNDSNQPRVAVRLRGQPPNTAGIGARLSLIQGTFVQSQEMMLGGRYLSSDEPLRVFAWRVDAGPGQVEIRWRSGARSVVQGVQPNHIYEIAEPTDFVPVQDAEPFRPAPLFEDVSNRLNHRHHDAPFDDFQIQSLLPNKLSQLGPGLAWQDFDGDGSDDLVIGSGRDGRMALFRNDGDGRFSPFPIAALAVPLVQDQSGVIAPNLGHQTPSIVVGFSNYESSGPATPSQVGVLDPAGVQWRSVPLDWKAAAGPIAAADYDADGDLDLFVGGRSLPGRYPEPASSMLLRREKDQWITDTDNSRVLNDIGLVTSAVFSDLDLDGYSDLVLACEWGPVRVLKNKQGQFADTTVALGLDRYTGWWNGVATADLDEDGRPDIIAANWGLNSKYRASSSAPRRIYFGDFDGNKTLDLFEAYFDHRIGKEVPERDLKALRAAVPLIMERFGAYQSYASASLGDVLGDKLSDAEKVEANTLASTVFFNRGGRFEAQALPWQAQLAPAFAVVAADFNGDSHEDLFLSQNFFSVQPTTSRNDAGQGLLLIGNGRGELKPMLSLESGIRVFGEQRGAAAADFDRDGRLDLVVTQNGAATCLFRNSQARPGYRIRLAGPDTNPDGIGAAVRLLAPNWTGPWREIQSGSGYWSQNSPAIVLSGPEKVSAAEVRWPGGRVARVTLPVDSNEFTITFTDRVLPIKKPSAP